MERASYHDEVLIKPDYEDKNSFKRLLEQGETAVL